MTADEAINLHCNIKLCFTVFLLFASQTHEPGNKQVPLLLQDRNLSSPPLFLAQDTDFFHHFGNRQPSSKAHCLGVPDAERLKVSDFKKDSDGCRIYTGTQ